MTRNEIESFLNHGAILRRTTGEVYLWRPDENGKNVDKSIHYLPFFGSQLELVAGLGAPEVWAGGDLRAALQAIADQPAGLRQSQFSQLNKVDFEQSFQEIMSRIHRGEIEKAVPALFSIAESAPTLADRAQMIFNLLQSPSSLYVYGFWNKDSGILGATPELLFAQDENSIETMALAGTRPKNAGPERLALLQDPKELNEHQLVIKDLIERLSRFGLVRTDPTEEVELPKLFHLRTRLRLESSRVSAEDLARLLHPTAALGVAPRNYGIQWMQNLPQQKDRDLFGGAILFRLSPKQSLCLVAIRNLQWQKNISRIGVGCGLISDSEIEREWDELRIKNEMIFSVLGLKP